MNTDRFKYRVAIRQDNGTFKVCDVGIIWFMCDKIIVEYSYVADANHGKLGRAVIDGENAILLQCTGLTDKNGRLIYENDVVNMYIYCEDAHRKCVVEYCIDVGTAQWICRYLDGSRKHQFFGNPFDITTEYLDGFLCEIIGNIHDDQFREASGVSGKSGGWTLSHRRGAWRTCRSDK